MHFRRAETFKYRIILSMLLEKYAIYLFGYASLLS